MKRCALAVLVSAVLCLSSPLYPETGIDNLAMSFFLRGVFLESRKDLVHAYSFYTYAASRSKDNKVIQLRLARVTLELGELEKARTHAGNVLEQDPSDSEALLLLAEIDYDDGNFDLALSHAKKLYKRNGVAKFDILKFMARIYLERKRVPDARVALEEARDLNPGDLYVLYKLGFIYAGAGEVEKAIDTFRQAAEANAGVADIHVALASLLRQTGKLEEAKRSYRNALQIDPTNRNALGDMAGLLYDTGEFGEGVRILEPLYEAQLLGDGGKIHLGKFYCRAGESGKALEIYTGLLMKLGEKPSLLRIIAEVEMDIGNLRSSYEHLSRLIVIEPDNFSNYIGLLLIAYGITGNEALPGEEIVIPRDEAAAIMEKAVDRIDPASADDHYLIGAICRKAKENERAGKFLLRAEELNPGDPNTLLELATYFEIQKQFDEALKRVVTLYEKDPEDASLGNFYGYLLAEKGERLEFAEQLLRKALEAEPDNGYFLDSLGWIKYRKGEYDSAMTILKAAIEKAGEDPVIWKHLGETYIKLGLPAEALSACRKSLSLDPEDEDVRTMVETLETSRQAPEK